MSIILENVILGFLMEGSMSGYDIKNFMSFSTANFFDASFGSIYPALKRLETKGFISSIEAVQGGKYKKKYEITEAGKIEFFRWLEEPANLAGGGHEHLLKVFFFNHIEKEKARLSIKKMIEAAKEELRGLEKLEPYIKDKSDGYKFSTLLFGVEYYKFIVGWYERFLERLEQEEFKGGLKHEHCSIERKSKG
ncbi:MAG: PadR family transcriptional regulator [Ruminiclostridium sp.]